MKPTTSIGIGALLAKYSVTIAGFWGSILLLGSLKDLIRFQTALAIGTGFGYSTCWTQPVAGWLFRTYLIPLDDAFLAGVASTIGLPAMNATPGLKAFAERFLTPRGAWP